MSIPQPRNSGNATGHPTYILFTGAGIIKSSLLDFGLFFEAEVEDDSLHCLLVDPRFDTQDIANYIVELGGSVYVRPPDE